VRRIGPDLHSFTGVYALNAMAGAEQGRFERHLGSCHPCVTEVRGLHETVSELALAVAALPPPGFRERVLAAVPAVEQLPLAGPPAGQPARGAVPEAPRRPGRSRPARRRPAHKLQRRRLDVWLPRVAVGVAAVATVAAVILGVRLNSVENQLGVSKATQVALTKLLNTPGVRVLAARTSLGGDATAVHVPGQSRVVVLTRDLPPLPASKVYQVWLINSPRVGIRSAGLLERPTNGLATLLASGVVKGDVVGITVEPAGGTKQPTTKPFVELKLKA
jgi:hypothetical protein